MSGISESRRVKDNPYVGPRSIQLGEPLYGRDKETYALFDKLQARRIVVLHSPSGAGKSSLVQAGLIPELRNNQFDVWKPIRVNLDPSGLEGVPAGTNRYLLSAMLSLEEELPDKRRRSPAALAKLDFATYLDTRPRRKKQIGRSVVLIFDQFEEVLTIAAHAVEAKRAFFDGLGQALQDEHYWALFVARDDYLAAFAPYRDRVPTGLANTFRLDLLGVEGARAAALEPALGAGRKFPAVDQLIRDLSMVQVQQDDGSFVAEQGIHVEPVQLQVVCRRLWASMPEDNLSIDAEDIEQYASVSESLAAYYAEAVAAVAGDDQVIERKVRDWVGRQLIVGGIRSQVRQGAGESGGLDNELIQGLLDTYVVRTEHRAGANWFELSHDRMVEPVTLDNEAWDREHLHLLQVQAKLWVDGKRSKNLLLSAEMLPESQLWAARNNELVTPDERDFLKQSIELRAREALVRNRLKLAAAGAVVTTLVIMAFGLFAALQRKEALEALDEAQTARDEAEAAQGEAELARDEALAAKRKARDTSLMASVRELLAHEGARTTAALLLGEVEAVEEARGWVELANATLLQLPPQKGSVRHGRGVNHVAWSPDGRRVVTASADGTARVWDAEGGGAAVVLAGHEDGVRHAAWSPDGTRLVTASADGTARVWDAEGGGAAVVLAGHEDWVRHAAWSPDGTRLVTASADGTARVWDAEGGGAAVVLAGHEDRVVIAAWSPDGTRLVTASADGTARVWDAEGGGEAVVLAGHEDALRHAAWSPDGTRLVTASHDGTARVWDAEGRGEAVVLAGHEDVVRHAAWSPDGTRLATASEDGTARVWDAEGGEEAVVMAGHESMVLHAAWSPDGTRVVTASRDETVRIWNVVSGEAMVLAGHRGSVSRAYWNPEGDRIVTASEDKTARIWTVDIPRLQQALRDATPDCLRPDQRELYLGESRSQALTRFRQCERDHGRERFGADLRVGVAALVVDTPTFEPPTPESEPTPATTCRHVLGLLAQTELGRDTKTLTSLSEDCEARFGSQASPEEQRCLLQATEASSLQTCVGPRWSDEVPAFEVLTKAETPAAQCGQLMNLFKTEPREGESHISGANDRAIRSTCVEQATLGAVDLEALRRDFDHAVAEHTLDQGMRARLEDTVQTAAIERCYEASLLADDTAKQGTVVLDFVLDPDGKVTSATPKLERSDIQDPDLGACVAEALSWRTFNIPEGTSQVRATVTYRLSWR